MPIPVSIIVVTKNTGKELETCLNALTSFEDLHVVDSGGNKETEEIAEKAGAHFTGYQWNGLYPKKRGWCLENLPLKYDWVFFVDADEIVTPELTREIRTLFSTEPMAAGYFIYGQYIWNGQKLSFGLRNKKIALFNRHKMFFPHVDDLDCPGMGEIEGHYQPVLISNAMIGTLQNPLLHCANHSPAKWLERHKRYAAWEICMNKKESWPDDPVPWRNWLKTALRKNPLRPEIAFFHSYVLKRGFLDGRAGFDFAKSRWNYYRFIRSGHETTSIE